MGNQKSCTSRSDLARRFDNFGTQVELNADGKQVFQTVIGSVLSILINIIGFATFVVFSLAVFEEKDLTIVTSNETNHYDQEEWFGAKDGLRLAFAVTTDGFDPWDHYDLSLYHTTGWQ